MHTNQQMMAWNYDEKLSPTAHVCKQYYKRGTVITNNRNASATYPNTIKVSHNTTNHRQGVQMNE